MRTAGLALALAVLGTSATVANATVDAYLPYHIVYRTLHTDDLCVRPQMMWAEIGIPPASVMEASAAPALIFRQSSIVSDYVNINELATEPPMVPSYVGDAFDAAGVLVYDMTLDVSDLAAANGKTTAGRAATVRAAKLYLIAMAANLDALTQKGWRLNLSFVGLPSQDGLSGTRLYERTMWPYTASSALLNQYRSELIDVGGTCP